MIRSLLIELRKVPMLPMALAVAGGVLVALHVDVSPAWMLLTCAALFAGAVVSVCMAVRPAVWLCAALIFLAGVGAYRATVHLDRATRRDLYHLAVNAEVVTVAGRVYLPAADAPGGNRVVLEMCEIASAADTVASKISRVRLYADSLVLSHLRYGDRVYAVGHVVAGWKTHGTQASLTRSVVRRELASIYADSLSVFVAPAGQKSLRSIVDRLRGYVREVFEARLSPDGAALSKALLLGDQSEFGPEFSNNLRLTGLSHIFALSGMNTGLIVLMVWMSVSWLPLPHSARLWLLLCAVVFYMEIGREAPSLVRSSLVAASMITGHLIHRRAVFLNLVLGAAFIELLWKPLDLVDAGFLLSYLAVFGIVGAYVRLRHLLLFRSQHASPIARITASLAAGTLSSQAGTMPLVAYLFHRVPLAGLLGNVIAVPGFACLLILAVCLLLMHSLLPWLAVPTANAIGLVAWGMGAAVNISAALPAASVGAGSFSIWVLLGLCTAAGVLIVGIGFGRGHWIGAGLLLAANVVAWNYALAPRVPVCEVTFMDVENGDATLISAGGRNVLVDAGPCYDTWSAAHRIVPVLAERGIHSLDAIVLTHPDNDHIGGAAALMQRMPVLNVYTNGERGHSRTAVETELACTATGARCAPLVAGDKVRISQHVELVVLSPDAARLTEETSENRKSLVLRLDAGSAVLLLTADIDSTVEHDLAGWGEELRADLIKAPHHGARSGTSGLLLTLTSPKACVISSGSRNPFGHPAVDVLGRLEARQIDVFRTDRLGHVMFVAGPQGWRYRESSAMTIARRWRLT